MKNMADRTGFSELEYMDIPHSGTRAYRDRRKDFRPKPCIPFNPNWKVRIVFKDITFSTNVDADDEETARLKAVQNLRYTFFPEHNLKALGGIKDISIHRM